MSTPSTGAPHAAVGGDWVKRSFSWARTVWGFTGRVGLPNGEQWCLGEEGSGWHRVGRRSLHVERC